MIIKNIRFIQEKIEQILSNSGIVKGFGLNIEELKKEERITYFRDFATTKGANEKDRYLLWKIEKVENNIYGDAQVINTDYVIKLLFYTRHYLIDNELENVEKSFLENHFSFKFDSMDFNPEYRAYIYQFDIRGTF